MATPLPSKLIAESSNKAVLNRVARANQLIVIDDPALVRRAVVAGDVVVDATAF